jgi:hypothetical protein
MLDSTPQGYQPDLLVIILFACAWGYSRTCAPTPPKSWCQDRQDSLDIPLPKPSAFSTGSIASFPGIQPAIQRCDAGCNGLILRAIPNDHQSGIDCPSLCAQFRKKNDKRNILSTEHICGQISHSPRPFCGRCRSSPSDSTWWDRETRDRPAGEFRIAGTNIPLLSGSAAT